MIADNFTITTKRNGEKTRLTIQGPVHGIALNLSLEELGNLALLLADARGQMCDEVVNKAEDAQTKAEPDPLVTIN